MSSDSLNISKSLLSDGSSLSFFLTEKGTIEVVLVDSKGNTAKSEMSVKDLNLIKKLLLDCSSAIIQQELNKEVKDKNLELKF